MERHVKERLIGAAVLMAAAIILIPEMLSGPDRAVREPAARTLGDTPLKTYTIDLQQSREGASAVEHVSERAPPPEQIASEATAPAAGEPEAASQANPERVAQDQSVSEAGSSARTSASQFPASARARVEETPTPVTRAAPPQHDPPAAIASSPATSASGRWAVQIGSFSKQATADRLVGELRAEGHHAFVMPVRSGATSLHRVRVGPFQDRTSAETALRTLRTRAAGAAVVAHP